ncbi:hypothetical protein AGMMS50276_31160 [Synergistales bacterium]|nr:hypothetical protein AGMMS50276_31160 [Synergistales bacterium]
MSEGVTVALINLFSKNLGWIIVAAAATYVIKSGGVFKLLKRVIWPFAKKRPITTLLVITGAIFTIRAKIRSLFRFY